MKRLILLASLISVTCAGLVAAPVKTSKAAKLTSAEMNAVKGEGYFYVWVWHGNTQWDPLAARWVAAPGGFYVAGPGSGPCSFDGYIYVGGPAAGQSKLQ